MKKEKGASVKFAILEKSGGGPIIEEGEVSGNQVSVATRQVDISAISGEDAWGNKNWPKECSSAIDAGFNG